MFKSDIMTIISGICYNCKQIQDEVYIIQFIDIKI